jgi:hypothetical protein
MKSIALFIKKSAIWLNTISEFILICMMMLTVFDVVLRIFGAPIVGTYEIVGLTGAAIIGLSVAKTTWDRGHVFVDFLLENRTKKTKNAFFIGTRIVGIITYALITWNLFLKGFVLQKAGEVSLTLRLPHYPIAFVLSFCFLVQCFTLVADILRINENVEQGIGE